MIVRTRYLRLNIMIRIPIICVLVVFASLAAPVRASLGEVVIETESPVFVLPQFTGFYSEREASIAPEEYETAERWKSMLDSGDSEAVLAELEEFYDIELSPAMMTLKAQIFFSLKRYDEAEKVYLAVLKRKPHLVRAYSDLGQLYLIREDFVKARDAFAKAVSYGSNEAIIHGQLGYLNLSLHGPFTAVSEYQQALALEPNNPQWQQGLIAALTQANMYEAANALLKDLLQQHPENINHWLNQAVLAVRMNEPYRALASLEMAILLGDKRPQNLKSAAKLHLQIGSYDRAFELLKTHVKTSQLTMATVSEYLGWMGQVGMWGEAQQMLDDMQPAVAKMNSSEQSLYYFHAASVADARKNRARADRDFQLALEKNPVNSQALLAYAGFLQQRGDSVRAELLYIRAEDLPESEKKALLGRAQLYLDQKDYKSGLIYLRSAYQKYPELTELRENITAVESILRARQAEE